MDEQHPEAWRRQLQADWAANAGSPESRLIVSLYRLARLAHTRLPRGLRKPLIVLYRLVTYLVLHVELPPEAVIGGGLRVYHPHMIVLHPRAVLGRDVVLRHGVTIGITTGRDGTESRGPVIGDGVEFGAGAMVLGPVTVGRNARIGAGAIVLKDVPPGAVVAGNPASVLRIDPDALT
ncbi:MAG: colanic acid biosynthesis acetyltransferase [Frankiales bacterium]|nr:colanic acid biosynthesis acetyltransferase [Frankiales bacterium]